VEIERGILDRRGKGGADAGKCACAVVTDDHVAPLYLRRVEESLDRAGIRHASVTLPHGEQTKCLAR
jgi:3-dehydroquinate synthase